MENKVKVMYAEDMHNITYHEIEKEHNLDNKMYLEQLPPELRYEITRRRNSVAIRKAIRYTVITFVLSVLLIYSVYIQRGYFAFGSEWIGIVAFAGMVTYLLHEILTKIKITRYYTRRK